MNKFIVFALLVSMVASKAVNQVEDMWYGEQEAACVSQGGLCIANSQCSQLLGRQGELCPNQAAQGFQCCSGLPKNEKRCRKRGGECFKKGFCTQIHVYSEASDCEDEQDCCILI